MKSKTAESGPPSVKASFKRQGAKDSQVRRKGPKGLEMD
jgi:hypothetical protein